MAKKPYELPLMGDVDFIHTAEDDGFFRRLTNQLYNSNANWARVSKKGLEGATEDSVEGALFKMFAEQQAFAKSPLSTKVDVNGIKGNALKNTVGALGANIKAHPFAAAGLGALGAANVAGLVDDNKVGAQLIGGAAGAALPALFGASPMTTIALGATGGALGSLFDKLRAKKEAEQQSMYQQKEY